MHTQSPNAAEPTRMRPNSQDLNCADLIRLDETYVAAADCDSAVAGRVSLAPGSVRGSRASGSVRVSRARRSVRASLTPTPPRARLGAACVLLAWSLALLISPIAGDALAELYASPWAFENDQLASRTGQSVCSAGDVNGDGYSDVLIGAPLYTNGETEEGRVYLFYGSANGILQTTPDWIAEVDSPNAHFGECVSTGGDVNGDGFDDVIIGASGYIQDTDVGAAFIWFGGPDGIREAGTSENADWIVTGREGSDFGQAVAYAGDVNDDGFDDVAVGAPRHDNARGAVHIFHGSASGPGSTEDTLIEGESDGIRLGTSVAGGDVTSDGFSDVIAGAPNYSNGQTDEGRMTVYLGGPGGISTVPAAAVEVNQAGALMGTSVGFAGDMNGDGFGEAVVGIPGWDLVPGILIDNGGVGVYAGTATGINTTITLFAKISQEEGAALGTSVGPAGDVDGDGRADIVYGAPDHAGALGADDGAVFVAGMLDGSLTQKYTILGDDDQAEYGASSIGAGDINGDGYSDIVVGDPEARDFSVRIIYGRPRPHGLLADPVQSFVGTQNGERLGSSVAWADVNADGYSDLIAGAPSYAVSGNAGVGRISCRHGSPTGLAATPNVVIEGFGTFSFTGTALARAGDVDGDGYDDVLVGAPGGVTSAPIVQAAIFPGGPNGLGSTPLWIAGGFDTDFKFGRTLCGAGDINGDGFADIAVGSYEWENSHFFEGAVRAYLGQSGGPSSAASWTFEGNDLYFGVGFGLAGGGDMNGDGFSDLAVLAFERATNNLHVLLFYGSAAGLPVVPNHTLDAGQTSGNELSVAVDGDLNGDGFSDVLVGLPGTRIGGQQVGAVYAWYGGPGGYSTNPNLTWNGTVPRIGFGSRVAYAGDLDGDGQSDFAFSDQSEIETEEQRVYVVASRDQGTYTVLASALGDQIGYALAGTGDANGDGTPDLAVGVPGDGNTGSAHGAVRVFTPGADYGISRRVAPITTEQNFDVLVPFLGKSDAFNSLRFVLRTITPEGRGRTFYDVEVKPLGVLFDGQGLTESVEFDTALQPNRRVQVAGLSPATAYHWRVAQRTDWPFAPRLAWQTPAGSGPDMWDIRTGGSAVSVEPPSGSASINWSIAPNPVRDRATISLSLEKSGPVRLDLVDVTGRRVERIHDGVVAAADQVLEWELGTVPAGVYFLRMASPDGVESRRVVIRR